MQYVRLGKTELMVSPICVGTWQLAGPVTFDGQADGHPDPGRENAIRLIKTLGDRGINHIDTAEQYGGGDAERRTGEALIGQRDRWIISTKFGYRIGPGQTRIDDSSPGTIMASLEGSLQRLQTDYIDIYLYHCAPDFADLPAAREILEQAREQGKIRWIGISTDKLPLLETLNEHNLLDVVQYPTSLLTPREDIREFALAHDVGTQLRGVMAQGRLSGKYFAGAGAWDINDNRLHRIADEDLSRFKVLQAALPSGYTMTQAAIRWALDQPGHHTICMGAKSLADYDIAIAALDLPPLGAASEKLTELAGSV